ncbi:MAG: hypothetical protein WC435_02840 [Candidatus Paceibacterota bacterium]
MDFENFLKKCGVKWYLAEALAVVAASKGVNNKNPEEVEVLKEALFKQFPPEIAKQGERGCGAYFSELSYYAQKEMLLEAIEAIKSPS